MEEEKLLDFAVSIGESMLKNGGETFRVEDLILKTLSVNKEHKAEAYIVTTAIVISLKTKNSGTITEVRRIKGIFINLGKIKLLNDLVENFYRKRLTLDEAIIELEKINNLPAFPRWQVVACYGIISFSFALIFDSGIPEALICFIIAAISGYITTIFHRRNFALFPRHVLSGTIITFLTAIAYKIQPTLTYDIMVVSLIMPYLPGVAVTNAIRDIMNRDYLSGSCRLLEASVRAGSIALGVAVVYGIFGMGGL